MRIKPYLFYNSILQSTYAKKVFRENNYDYLKKIDTLIEDSVIPSSYENCNSVACTFDYTEPTEFKPDLLNENLNMAA